jgi:hypothetical protein
MRRPAYGPVRSSANKLVLLLGGSEPNQLLFGFAIPVQPAKDHGQGVVGGGVPRVLTDRPLRPVEPALGLVELPQCAVQGRAAGMLP